MKILEAFGEPISNGGQERFVMNVVSNMNLKNIYIDLLTPYYCDNKFIQKKISSIGGHVYELKKVFNPGGSRFNIYKDLNFFLQKNKFDIVHIHSGSISILGIFAYTAKKNGIKKVIVHSHSSIEKSTLRNKILKYICSKFLNKYADIYCACSTSAGKAKFLDKIVDKKLIILKNGIEIDKFKYSELKRKEIRNILNVNNKFLVGHVGRFSYEKNHKFLINIFYEIQKINKEAMLVLIGDGELKYKILRQVKDLGIEEKVIFLGNVNNVFDYYQAMDCFVLPSFFEGLSFVSIEAQTSGLPCFVSDMCPKDIAITDNLHYISLKRTSVEWAKVILKKSNVLRIDNSANIVRNGFDIKSTVKTIKQIYEV